MASRASLIQSRSIYVGTLNSVAPSDGNLIVTGNVGIGTTSPNYKLDVNGSINIYSGNSLRWGSGDVEILNSGYSMLFSTYTGSALTEKMRITSAGNVGIGTTSPTSKLTIKTNNRSFADGENAIRIEYPGSPAPGEIGGGIVFSQYWYNLSTDIVRTGGIYGVKNGGDGAFGGGLAFYTQPNSADPMVERMRITQDGNVGIGTTSPAAKLHIAGGTDVSIIRLENTSTGLSQGDTIGAIQFYNNDTTDDSPNVAASIYATAGPSGGSGYLSFRTKEAGTEGAAATATMTLTNGGNVGIGTTSPVGKLDVALLNTRRFIVTYDDSLVTIKGANDTGAGENLRIIGDNLIFNTSSAGSGSERMRITNTGDVGIGTTSPLGPLDVRSTGLAQIYFGYPNAGEYGYLGRDANTGLYSLNVVQNANLAIWTNNTERMRITAAGNVGIGTTSPYDKLEVNGAIAATGSVVGDSGQGHSTTLAVQSGVSYLYAVDWGAEFKPLSIQGKTISLETGTGSTSARVTIDNSGNVGIGTTSPSDILHVQKSGANTRMIVGNNAAYDQFIYFQGNNDWSIGIDNSNSNAFTLSNYSTIGTNDRLTVTTSGNVGIGTTSPGYKLEVNGDVGFSGGASLKWGGNTYLYGDNNIQIQAVVNGNTGWFINSSGNVGIGTTSPVTQLQVASATNAVDVLRIGNTAGDSGSVQGVTHLAINHFNAGTNPSTRITAYQDGVSGWPGGMYFSTRSLNTDSAPVERMRITSGGNVGIGTTSPSNILHITNVMRMDNATGNAPAVTSYTPRNGYGDVETERCLADPAVWLKINIGGTEYVIPAYTQA